MSDEIHQLWPYLLGSLALYFFGLPALIYGTFTMKARPQFGRFDPYQTPPPGSAGRYFAEVDQELKRLGFEWREGLTVLDLMETAKALTFIYSHPKSLDSAMMAVAWGINPTTHSVNLTAYYVEFVARYRDGNIPQLETNNNRVLGAFPDTAQSRKFRFPHLEDIEHLLQLHEKLQEREQPGGRKYLRLDEEFRGDCAEYLQTIFREEFERQVGTRYLYYRVKDDTYCATIKGALLMTWKQLWPFKGILTAGIAARGKRLERELM